MSQETKNVLEMLASGSDHASDAEKLLEKLGQAAPPRRGFRGKCHARRRNFASCGGSGQS